MKNIFNPTTLQECKLRIQKVSPDATAQWGKMNVYEMLKHCTEGEKMLLRENNFKRLFIGRLFGKMALKSNLKNDAPLSKNSDTHPSMKIKGTGDVTQQKQAWLSLLDKYATKADKDYEDFIHPFFGKMSKEQVGQFAFKHVDHHLRQFGA